MFKEENYKGDLIAKLAISRTVEMPKGVLIETTKILCTEKILVLITKERKDWQTPTIKYPRDDTLPPDSKEAKKVVRWPSRYAIDSNDELYQRSFSRPLLKYLGLEDTQYALREVHEGIHRVHIRVKTLTTQVIQVGFF